MVSTNTRQVLTFILLAILARDGIAIVSQSSQSSVATGLSFLSTTTTSLHAGLFGQDGVLGGLFSNRNERGPKTIVDLPAKDVKIGALRFFLQIHLVGEQNKPVPKSWVTRQSDDAGGLQVYYQDGTGMLSIQLLEYAITVVRYGEQPSLQYQLQESVLVHRVLDELANIAFGVADDGIEPEKRLLVLRDESAIDKARERLPARPISESR